MHHKFSIFLVTLLLISLVFPIFQPCFIQQTYASPGYEDITTFTEVDTDNKLTNTTTRITWTEYLRQDEGRIYKSYGAGHFTDFEHWFDTNFTWINAGDSTERAIIESYMVCTSNDRGAPANDTRIQLVQNAGNDDQYYVRFRQLSDSVEQFSNQSILVNNVGPAYWVLNKSGSTWRLDGYNTTALRTAGGNGNVVDYDETGVDDSYEYIIMARAMGSTPGADGNDNSTGYLEYLDLNDVAGTAPTASNVGEAGHLAGDTVTFYANWTSDSGAVTHYNISVYDGTWQNSTLQSISGTYWSNHSVTIGCTASYVQWNIQANNSIGWGTTNWQYFNKSRYGYLEVGDTPISTDDYMAGPYFYLEETVNASSIWAYMMFNGSGEGGHYRAAIYNSTENLVAQTAREPRPVPDGPLWVQANFTSYISLTQGWYYLMVRGNWFPYLYFSTNASIEYYEEVEAFGADGEYPPTLAGENTTGKRYSVYLQAKNLAVCGPDPYYDANSISHNTTVTSQPCLFTSNWHDDEATLNWTQFSTNNTGVWANTTVWINQNATDKWSNYTITLNATDNLVVGYQWFCADVFEVEVATSIFTLTTIKIPNIRNVDSNTSVAPVGQNILLYSEGYDASTLRYAWISTNETGAWINYTDTHVSRLTMEILYDQFNYHYANLLAGTYLSKDGNTSNYRQHVGLLGLYIYLHDQNSTCLDIAEAALQECYDQRKGTTDLLRQANATPTYQVTEVRIMRHFYEAIGLMGKFNNTFDTYYETLGHALMKYGYNHTNGLTYQTLDSDGLILVGIGDSASIERYMVFYVNTFLNVYDLTGNDTFKEQVGFIIDSRWKHRNKTTAVMPHRLIGRTNSSVEGYAKQGPGPGAWLQCLSAIIFRGITGISYPDAQYCNVQNILSGSANRGYKWWWNSTNKRWNYRLALDGSTNSTDTIPEMRFHTLDRGFIMAAEALNNDTYYTRVEIDLIHHYLALIDGNNPYEGLFPHSNVRDDFHLRENMYAASTMYLCWLKTQNDTLESNADDIFSSIWVYRDTVGRYRIDIDGGVLAQNEWFTWAFVCDEWEYAKQNNSYPLNDHIPYASWGMADLYFAHNQTYFQNVSLTTYENYTYQFFLNHEVGWRYANFTWRNDTASGAVGWRVYYQDADGHVNMSAIHAFSTYVDAVINQTFTATGGAGASIKKVFTLSIASTLFSSIDSFLSLQRSLSSALSITAVSTVVKTLYRSFSALLTFNSTVVSGSNYIVGLGSSLVSTAQIQAAVLFRRTLAATATLLSSISRTISVARTLTASIQIISVPSVLKTLQRTTTAILEISASVQSFFGTQVQSAASILLGSNVVMTWLRTVTSSALLQLTSTVSSGFLVFQRNVVAQLILSSASTVGLTLQRTFTASLTILTGAATGFVDTFVSVGATLIMQARAALLGGTSSDVDMALMLAALAVILSIVCLGWIMSSRKKD